MGLAPEKASTDFTRGNRRISSSQCMGTDPELGRPDPTVGASAQSIC